MEEAKLDEKCIEKCRNELKIKSHTNTYVMKQFESLIQFKNVIDSIADCISETPLLSEEYVRLLIKSNYDYRNNYLEIEGLVMSKEERAFWNDLERAVLE